MWRLIAVIIGLVFLIILVGFAAYFVGTLRGRTTPPGVQVVPPLTPATPTPPAGALTPTPITTTPLPILTPLQVVQAYYSWYSGCLALQGPTCSYINYQYIDPQLINNIASRRVTSIDPIICAQNLPSSILIIGVTSQSSNTATVSVLENFETFQRQILVDLQLIDNQWKITNVTCPST